MSTIQHSEGHPSFGFPAWLPWVLGGILIVILMLRDYLMLSDGVIDHAVVWGRDFINVWTGGTLVSEGRPELVYDLRAYPKFQQELFGDIDPHYYSYPPVTFPLAALLAAFPYSLALAAWLGGTGALFALAARPWWPERAGWPLLALATPAALVNIWAGHYGFLIGALFLFGWHRLDDRPVQAGIFFGLMIIKPHLAVLIPLVLLIRGDWRAIASAAATVALLLAMSVVIYGWQPWHDFLFRTSALQASLIDPQGMFFRLMTPSLAGSVLQLGGPWLLALTLQCVIAAFAVALVVRATLHRASVKAIALLVATCTFLVLPYSFNYDMTVVMIGALAIMTRRDVSPIDYRFALFGFLAPQFGMALAALSMPLMWLMVAGLAWAQYRVAIGDADGTRAPAAPAASISAR